MIKNNLKFLMLLTLISHVYNVFNLPKTNIKSEIYKEILDNGLTVLIKPNHIIPTVSIQMWYNVGSKDEKTNEKGLAHLLEHMVFKGTKDLLSETDIFKITNKLSGYCNAATSYDYTKFIFKLPTRHWKESLPILADCMCNCNFKQDLLNSEFKAVIQELKMYRDNYQRTLLMEMISTIFPSHPYHYPIIGFKQDIWNINSKNLLKFYKKHYKPNNAILVIVGDVNPEDAFKAVKENFKTIEKDNNYKKEKFHIDRDLISRNIVLRRDIKKIQVSTVFIVPGIKENKEFALDLINEVLGSGKGSRLYQKIVEEKQLAINISSSHTGLFDHGLFFITFEPKSEENIDEVIKLINEEILNLSVNGINEHEFKKLINNQKIEYYKLMENNDNQAEAIGFYYLATNNENYIFEYFNKDISKIKNDIKNILDKYFTPAKMHKGYLLPANETEKKDLLEIQKQNDLEDANFLENRIRESAIEPEKYANTINPKSIEKFNFPKPQEFELKNGIKVLYYNNQDLPTINLILQLKADQNYDSKELPGLHKFTFNLLNRGTEKHSYKEILDETESRGINLNFTNGLGTIYCSNSEIETALNLFTEMLTSPKFDEKEIEKIREQMFSTIKSINDDAKQIANQMIRQNIYKNHPYGKNFNGTEESIKNIKKEDIVNFYKKFISPKGSIIAVVGDLSNCDIKNILENTIGNWQGPEINDLEYPNLEEVEQREIIHQMNRDQVVLTFAGLSIDRKHPDFEKLSLFDVFYSQGLGSKLYNIRQQTGIFYTIGGSTKSNSFEQPGFSYILTIVSSDKLQMAQDLIKKSIQNDIETMTEEDLIKAKSNVIDAAINNYAPNSSIASTFLYCNKFDLSNYYYDNIAERINKITLDEIKEAAKKVLDINKLITVKVGRI